MKTFMKFCLYILLVAVFAIGLRIIIDLFDLDGILVCLTYIGVIAFYDPIFEEE